jgi:3-hydroxyisobutyrate dehydrogenase
MARVAVLGLGRMGAAMAGRLVDAGHDVSVWNRTQSVAHEFAENSGGSASWSATASEAVDGVDFVLLMLANGEATTSVVSEIMGSLSAEVILCDLGTSGVEVATKLANHCAEQQVRFVDAPVSGSIPAVLSGQLLIMASGDEGDVGRIRDVLLAFAKNVIFLGPAGQGQVMKLSVNLIVHTLNSAISESIALSSAAGIPLEVAYDVLSESAIAAPFVLYKRAAFTDADTPVAMSLGLVKKDLGLIEALAHNLDVDVIVTQAVKSEVEAACADGRSEEDMAALARYLQRRSA